MKVTADLGQAQFEILRYIQEHHPVTVRQVAGYLAETRGLTRTTALNVMETLREKSYLTREKIGGVYHYSPSLTKAQLLRVLVRDFVSKTLSGSVEPLVLYLAEEVHLNNEDTQRLQQLVQEVKDQHSEEAE